VGREAHATGPRDPTWNARRFTAAAAMGMPSGTCSSPKDTACRGESACTMRSYIAWASALCVSALAGPLTTTVPSGPTKTAAPGMGTAPMPPGSPAAIPPSLAAAANRSSWVRSSSTALCGVAATESGGALSGFARTSSPGSALPSARCFDIAISHCPNARGVQGSNATWPWSLAKPRAPGPPTTP
jgi:hypothetical protein